jgi:hypothetical protein
MHTQRSNMRLSLRAVNKVPVVLLRRAAQLWRSMDDMQPDDNSLIRRLCHEFVEEFP